jgi:hypothetical protein
MSDSSITGIEEIERRLKSINSRPLRIKILRKVANKVASNSKKRITAQTDLSGQQYAPRSLNSGDEVKKKKMLVGLRKLLRVVTVSEFDAKIGFTNPVTLKIAGQQQLGAILDPQHPISRNQRDGIESPATTTQAVALRKLGFKIKKAKGKGSKLATVQWIRQNLSVFQAGFAIRRMRFTMGITANRPEEIKLPPRSFLGITDTELQELLQMMNDEINQALA